jgi:hypothetical protein
MAGITLRVCHIINIVIYVKNIIPEDVINRADASENKNDQTDHRNKIQVNVAYDPQGFAMLFISFVFHDIDYSTFTPIFRAVPSTILMPASTS